MYKSNEMSPLFTSPYVFYCRAKKASMNTKGHWEISNTDDHAIRLVLEDYDEFIDEDELEGFLHASYTGSYPDSLRRLVYKYVRVYERLCAADSE